MEALPDLILLLARAPRWVHIVVSVLMALWSFATTLTLALRLVPESAFQRLESASPGLCHFFRSMRKLGTDLLPFLKELALAFVQVLLRVRAGVKPPAPPAALVLLALGAAASAGCIDTETRRLVLKTLSVSAQCVETHQAELFDRPDARATTGGESSADAGFHADSAEVSQ